MQKCLRILLIVFGVFTMAYGLGALSLMAGALGTLLLALFDSLDVGGRAMSVGMMVFLAITLAAAVGILLFPTSSVVETCLGILMLFWLVFLLPNLLLMFKGLGTLLFAWFPYTYAIAGLGAMVAFAAVVGALLPREAIGASVTRAADFHQPSEVVWQSLIHYENFPIWRQDLTGVTSLPPHEGRPRWREMRRGDKPMPSWVEIEEMVENKKLVTRVVFASWPTGRMQPPKFRFLTVNFFAVGLLTSWTYELSGTSTGVLLRVTEFCVEKNPFGRFLAYVREWRGHPILMTNYLLDLGKRFGEDVKVVG